MTPAWMTKKPNKDSNPNGSKVKEQTRDRSKPKNPSTMTGNLVDKTQLLFLLLLFFKFSDLVNKKVGERDLRMKKNLKDI